MEDIRQLECTIKSFDMILPTNSVLMIDVFYMDNDHGDLETQYYYADSAEKAIFFLDPLETVSLNFLTEVYGPKSIRHLGMSINDRRK